MLNKVHTKFKKNPDKNWSRYSWSAIVIILLWCGQKFRNNLPWSVPQYIIYKSFTLYSVGTNHLLKFFNIYYYFLDRGMLHPRVNRNYKQRAQTVISAALRYSSLATVIPVKAEALHRLQFNICDKLNNKREELFKLISSKVKNFTKLSNNQKLYYILTYEDQEILQSVGRFLYENMP